ncbi:MAG: hypothetical protein V4507_07085 [Verrucomicrobiota bacterium]
MKYETTTRHFHLKLTLIKNRLQEMFDHLTDEDLSYVMGWEGEFEARLSQRLGVSSKGVRRLLKKCGVDWVDSAQISEKMIRSHSLSRYVE